VGRRNWATLLTVSSSVSSSFGRYGTGEATQLSHTVSHGDDFAQTLTLMLLNLDHHAVHGLDRLFTSNGARAHGAESFASSARHVDDHVNLCQFVTIAGASRGRRDYRPYVNGVFDLVPELHNGRPLFRKRDDEDVWLRCARDGDWMVSSTEAKDANNLRGWALAPGSDYEDLPAVSGWRVSDGKGYAPDNGITVTHSDALKVQLAVSVAH
jgi:hypothetical protein